MKVFFVDFIYSKFCYLNIQSQLYSYHYKIDDLEVVLSFAKVEGFKTAIEFLNRITFNEEEMVINPEDVDPSIGRFRNLIETTVIPKKVKSVHLKKKSF
jgi:hypothetical protein